MFFPFHLDKADANNVQYIVQDKVQNKLFIKKEEVLMIAANFSTVRSKFKDFCDRVNDYGETIIVTRKKEKNVVILSAERYNQLEKAEKESLFLQKLDRGLKQVHAGQGITKSMEDLEAMAADE